jgi:hypothetical protein
MVSNDSNDDLTKLVVAQQEQIAELTKLVTTLVIASGPVLTKSHDDLDYRTSELQIRLKNAEDALCAL